MATILFVDDDQMVQSATRELLEILGYEVLSAASGGEALALITDRANRIDLILLDLSLPDINGLELLPRLTAERPGIGVVVCTGSIYEAASELKGHPEVRAVLQKPFDLQTLRETLRNSL